MKRLSPCRQTELQIGMVHLHAVVGNGGDGRVSRIVPGSPGDQAPITQLGDWTGGRVDQVELTLVPDEVLQGRLGTFAPVLMQAVAEEPELHAVDHPAEERSIIRRVDPSPMLVECPGGAVCHDA